MLVRVVLLCLWLCVLGGSEDGYLAVEGIEEEEEGEEGRKRGDSEGRWGEGCPTWTLPAANDCHDCLCGNSLDGVVKCDPRTLNVSIEIGYCMTYDGSRNATYVAKCSYGSSLGSDSEKYHVLPENISELNRAMCSPRHQRGRTCGACMPGFGPAVFSSNLNCYRCSGPYHGWGLYLFLELFPVTLFFLVIVLFQFRATAAPMNFFLLQVHMIVSLYQYYPMKGAYPFGKASNYYIKFILTVYGFWNLDFFRVIVPPFCVSEHVTGLYANSLLYLSVLYLLLLNVTAYVLIELHARDCRVIVWLWRPIHRCYFKFHRRVNPHNSIIDAFATSLILSYSRLMLASYLILQPLPLYTSTGKVVKHVVYHDATLDYLSDAHIPVLVLAVVVLVMLHALSLLLLLYPCKRFQYCLGKMRLDCHPLRAFADAFQGCYKNGSEGQKDYRYFAGLFLVLRTALYLTHALVASPTNWLLPALLFLIFSVCFANFRPYREDRYNTLDSVISAMGAFFLSCQAIITAQGDASSRPFQIIAQLGALLPLGYMSGLIIYHMSRFLVRKLDLHRHWDTNSETELPYRLLDE